MLSKTQRLTTASFDAVMNKGRVAHSPLFVVRYLQADNGSQLSAVVPQKVVKTSVGRHALRRKMYESVRPLMSRLASGVHIIVFAKQPAMLAEVTAIQADLESVFVKAGLLR